MDLYSVILANEGNTQILAGLLAILSMVVARLLDWYFPTKHHRKLNEEKEVEKAKGHVETEDFEEVEYIEENDNE